MQLHLELDEEERADKDYEELLKQEAERITVRGYQPPVSSFSFLLYLSLLFII